MPLILVTTDRRAPEGHLPGPRTRPRRPEVYLAEAYVAAVRAAGGTPLLLPPGTTEVEAVLAGVDGVVITGGAFDIHPSHYGQHVEARLDRVEPTRTETELALARACLARDLPVLGICGGLQVLAVAAGGSLVQDIATQIPDALEHEQPTDPAEGWHQVELAGGWLQTVLGERPVVNSTHHQAVDDPGHLRIVGRAPDGVVEACEAPDHDFCVGVQWHPELHDPAPYRLLVEAASRR